MEVILDYNGMKVVKISSSIFWFINPITGSWVLIKFNTKDIDKERLKLIIKNFYNFFDENFLFIKKYKIIKQEIFNFENYPNTFRIEFPNCNLRCKYCYFIRDIKNVQMRITPKEIIDFCKKNNFTQIQFHGGEPLLFFDWIREFVGLADELGVKFDYELQTNGTLLSEDVVLFLKEHDFRVGVSLDGPGFVHDFYRVFPDGSSSFDLVMRGINILKKHKVKFGILTTITRELIRNKESAVRFLKKLGVPLIFNIPMFQGGYSIKDISLDEITNFLLWYLETYGFDNTIKSLHGFTAFMVGNKSIIEENGEKYAVIKSNCGAGSTALSVNYDGRLYLCPLLPRGMSPGSIRDDFNVIKKNLTYFRNEIESKRLDFIIKSNKGLLFGIYKFGCPARSFAYKHSFLVEDYIIPVYEEILEKFFLNIDRFYEQLNMKKVVFDDFTIYIMR